MKRAATHQMMEGWESVCGVQYWRASSSMPEVIACCCSCYRQGSQHALLPGMAATAQAETDSCPTACRLALHKEAALDGVPCMSGAAGAPSRCKVPSMDQPLETLLTGPQAACELQAH